MDTSSSSAVPPPTHGAIETHCDPHGQLAPRRGGRPQDPVWDQVLVDDGIVSCLKCEKIIHISAPASVREFQLRFALWFYTTGMAFQKAEHNSLVDALRVLTPFTVVPNRHQLVTTLLDMCYDDLRSKLMLSAKGKRVTLTTDGYPTPTGRLSSTTCCSLRHPPCPDQLDFVTIAAVVTDNTATNRLVWSTLQQQKPNIFFHGCISHTLHLAVKDLVGRLPWLGKLTKNCRKLVRFLKKSQQLWYQLKRLQCMEGKSSLGLPTGTLWGTIKRYFSTVLASEKIQHAFVSGRGFLRARAKVQNTKRRHACDTVVARDFVQQLEKAIKLLKVISKFQKAFEKNTKPPSEV
ncbi:hypothetical protein PR001_g4544 [Phytophthora rubi]|uniref:DUF659 domain-containing protein n=1 Tax=Phytophthora rubi TaxID=129364 RepID=A0A6A3NZN8_9STRA|nr:hypothetical protein PR001_g4544 [Phytophthora rubi]